MSQIRGDERKGLSDSNLLIDEICDSFERAWKTDRPPSLAKFLAQAPEALRSGPAQLELLCELIVLDMDYRWRSNRPLSADDLPPRPHFADYARRFPELLREGEIPSTLREWESELQARHDQQNSGSEPDVQRGDAVPLLVTLSQMELLQDFELMGELGRGAFATVYFARQKSLDRLVALKISVDRGTEARTMASLEHDCIVKVHHEQIDAKRNLRVLSLQFVCGATLKDVIEWLIENADRRLDGVSLLEAVDQRTRFPLELSSQDAAIRNVVGGYDPVEAVCWVGICLSSALTAAHHAGVLHRDIKPANILVGRNGRCYLTDFNLARDERRTVDSARIGGTLAYMAPEHLAALLHPPGQEAPGKTADVYSLAVVLFELIALIRPFPDPDPGNYSEAEILKLENARRTQTPNCRAFRPDCAASLDHILSRAMQEMLTDRYLNVEEFSAALSGAGEIHRVEQTIPRGNRLFRFASRHPIFLFIAGGAFTNVVCLLTVLLYQFRDAVEGVEQAVRAGYAWQLTAAVLIPFVPTVLGLALYLRPLARFWRNLESAAWLDPAVAERMRQRIRWLVPVGLGVSIAGWMIGGTLMIAFHLLFLADSSRLSHLLLCELLAGSVACTYTYFVGESICVLILYLRMLAYVPEPLEVARRELAGVRRRLQIFQQIAFLPLLGALAALLGSGTGNAGEITRSRAFAASLIGLAIIGFSVSLRIGGLLQRMLDALQRVR